MPNNTPIKLWVDDKRLPPEGWVWAKSYPEARHILLHETVEEISLDYYLGNEKDKYGMERSGYDVLLILVQRKMLEHVAIPLKIEIHSGDCIYFDKMTDVINRYLK